mmetsp:Transcript_94223/g.202228  ORF Transcript_94223/g.202228 Transcript_94223/m.202228 type:complete len:214 (+) Transcript_94223:1160-1801(+)
MRQIWMPGAKPAPFQASSVCAAAFRAAASSSLPMPAQFESSRGTPSPSQAGIPLPGTIGSCASGRKPAGLGDAGCGDLALALLAAARAVTPRKRLAGGDSKDCPVFGDVGEAGTSGGKWRGLGGKGFGPSSGTAALGTGAATVAPDGAAQRWPSSVLKMDIQPFGFARRPRTRVGNTSTCTTWIAWPRPSFAKVTVLPKAEVGVTLTSLWSTT